MSEGSLFNSGFLGASFSWWVGQIADDSTWRDNILPGKFENANQITGWGRRYKVRIIGLHDQGETEIASDQLPWAQVMYPITAGGGQGSAGQTPNLRQGNMVFGFFLDGQEQQVPVIMGVLGNNAQTSLATKIGDGRVTNTQPGSLATSGYAEPASGNKDTNIRAPDEGLVINKPTPPGTPSASPKPGVVLDRFGRDPSRPPTRTELNAAQSARAEADRLGETGAVREARIANATVAATRQEAGSAASPASPAVPGATIENADAVHLQSNADTKRLDLYLKKSVMLSPCDLPGSAMKGMQTDIDNLTKDIDKVLQSASSYVDAVSQIGSIGTPDEQIQSLIEKYAPKIAKYMKIVFNKILEYTTKQINKVLGPLADIMFPNQRFQFFDIKIEITELIKCLFSKITDKLSKQILGTLNDKLKNSKPSKNSPPPTFNNPKPRGGTAPFVPICYVEELTGSIISANMQDMDDTVTTIVTSVGNFLKDIQLGQIGGIEESASNIVSNVSGSIGDVTKTIGNVAELISRISGGLPDIEIPDINASIVSAFSFENISMDIFGCDLKPNCPVSDFYSLQEGAGAAEEAQLPRPAQVGEDTENPSPVTSTETPPFAAPSKNTPDLKVGESNTETQQAATDESALTLF